MEEPIVARYAKSKDASSDRWISGAVKRPGQLHRDLGIPQEEKIPSKKLEAATKRPGKVGQRARLAKTLRKM